MLIATVEYFKNNDTFSYKGYLSDNISNTLGRFVAQDGASSNLLLDGFSSELGKQNRSFTMTKSSITIERLFKANQHLVDGVDISKPSVYRNNTSFQFFVEFFTLFNYAKTVPSDTVFIPKEGEEVSLEAREIISSVTTDFIKTPKVRGKVTREFGVVRELELVSDTMRISMSEDETYNFKPAWELKQLVGSDVLRMESQGTAYKIPIDVKVRNSLLGIKEKEEKILSLVGIDEDAYSPFYTTIEEVVNAHPDKNFDWIKRNIDENRFVIVTPKTLNSSLEQIKKDYEVIKVCSFDTETTGLNFNFKCFSGEGDKMVGVVLSAKAGTSYYFPLGHNKIENLCNGDVEYFVEQYLQPLFDYFKIVTHHNYFDWKVAHRHGLFYDCYFDTMVFVNKTYRAKSGMESGLKPLTERFLKRDSPELDNLCLNGDFSTTGATFADLSEELVRFYACPDADNTLSLFLYFKENGIIDEFNAWKSCLNDSAFSSVVAYSEFYGMHLNLDAVPSLREEWTVKREETHKALVDFIAEYAPSVDLTKYKTNSTAVNVDIAYNILGYPVQYSKKSGNPSLDKSAIKFLSKIRKPNKEPFTISTYELEKIVGVSIKTEDIGTFNELQGSTRSLLAKAYPGLGLETKYIFNDEDTTVTVVPEKDAPMYPFVSLLKKARDTERVFSTFLDKIGTYFTADGFCFPRVDAFKVTGRLSTSKPNIQGFDDLTKKEITARDGFYTVDTDYASKENRVIAIMSQEKALIDMFQDWRNDYHRFQASRMHGIIQELITDALRGESKSIVFGINFGMSDASLGEQLFGERSALNTEKAKQKRALFFSFQRHVEVWFENNVQTAINKGYSETIFGSRRFYNRSTTSKSQIRRYALNHPIQGSAADIYKAGMVSLFKDIKELGYLGKVLITGFIHDEATLEFHNSIHPHIALGLIRKNMMVELENSCPLHLGFGVGKSWYDAKKTEWQVGLQEKLEWDVDAYPWDGDIEKFYAWSVEQINQFNADDCIKMIESEKYKGDVFPVNYALELNAYLRKEITKGDNWKKAVPYVKDASKFLNSISDDHSSLVDSAKKAVNSEISTFHIHDRLELFKILKGYQRDGLEDEYKDISEIEVEVKQTSDDELEMKMKQVEKERQLQLIKNQIVDFGARLDMETKSLSLLYSKDFYQKVARLLRKESELSISERENAVSIYFYSFEADKFQMLQGYLLPDKFISAVVSDASLYV